MWMLKEYPDVLTVEQVAQILNIGINAAYRLVNSHEIGCRKIGKSIRVPKVCVVDYLVSSRYTVRR